MKFTKTNLDKLERFCHEAGYKVRYEKGNFQSGYCIVEQQKVVVVNKFFDLQGRITTLIDILPLLDIPNEAWTEANKALYKKMETE